MNRELTCIICPMGCQLSVEIEGGKVISVSGNTCVRGEKYAESECINPVRVITTTVRAKDGRVIAVKTDNPVPKDKMFECMDAINKLEPDAKDGLGVGDILCTNLLGTGANVVVTQKVSAL